MSKAVPYFALSLGALVVVLLVVAAGVALHRRLRYDADERARRFASWEAFCRLDSDGQYRIGVERAAKVSYGREVLNSIPIVTLPGDTSAFERDVELSGARARAERYNDEAVEYGP